MGYPNALRSAREIRLESIEDGIRKTKIKEFIQEEITTNRVEGLRKIKQQDDQSLIDGQSDIIDEFDECGLSAIVVAEIRLEGVEKLARVEVGRQLIEDYTLKNLRKMA